MIRFAMRHDFGGTRLDMAFDAPDRGTTVLFGPSGSGKSSVVAAMAGLFHADDVVMRIGDATLADTSQGVAVPAERRRIGLVFQDARLFPHMSVSTNLRYGARRAPKAGSGDFDAIVTLLGIETLLDRRPHTLSGGERQRVAIGRALLSQPRLLLMDEPLSGLDAARKAEILPYLAQLGPVLALPMIYVTHAMDELVRLADDVVLLEAGRVVASGPLPELAGRGDLPLAGRDDAGAILLLDVAAHDRDAYLTRLQGQGLSLLVPLLASRAGPVRVRIPAREVILATAMPQGISVHNRLAGRVRAVVEDGARHTAMVEVMVGSAVVLARVTLDAVRRLGLAPGNDVLALVKSTSIDVIAGLP